MNYNQQIAQTLFTPNELEFISKRNSIGNSEVNGLIDIVYTERYYHKYKSNEESPILNHKYYTNYKLDYTQINYINLFNTLNKVFDLELDNSQIEFLNDLFISNLEENKIMGATMFKQLVKNSLNKLQIN